MRAKQRGDCINMSGGRPPAEVFPARAAALGTELMNYGPHTSAGIPELRSWARELTTKLHSPPGLWERRDVILSAGNTDSISKSVLLLCDPGDYIFADCMCYSGIQAAALPLGRCVVGVAMDDDGMVPEALDAKISELGVGAGRARFIYLTPHGQNPTTVTLPDLRKGALYAVARKHNLIIVEDDPYLFVRHTLRSPGRAASPENMMGLESVPASFLSMDVDGRVVRLDTCSKMLAPGLRMGWVTGHKSILANGSFSGR